MSKQLTILLPIYNGNFEWISQSITSILNQSYRDFHLLIIDDGSESDIYDYLKKITDSRIKIIRNESNKGLTYTLNKGLQIATTPWVARMDSDDWAFPNRLKIQMEYLQTHPDTAVLGTNAIYLETEAPLFRYSPITHNQIVATLPFRCCICHPTVILNKVRIATEGGYPNIDSAEDYGLWMKLLLNSENKFHILPNFLLKYRKGLKSNLYLRRQSEGAEKILAQFDASLGISTPRSLLTESTDWSDINQWLDDYYNLMVNRFNDIDIDWLKFRIMYEKRKISRKLHESGYLSWGAYLSQRVAFAMAKLHIK